MSESSDGLTQKLEDLKIDRDRRRGSGRRPWGWFLLIAVVGSFSAFGAYWYWFRDAGELEVNTAVARVPQVENPDDAVLDGTGYVVARRQATVSSKATGKVIEVFIEEGMIVEEGQLLATLDDSLQRSQLELSRAQLEQSRSSLAEVEVRIKQAELDLERTAELTEKKLASTSELDQSKLALDALNAQLSSLSKNIEVSERALELQRQYLDDMQIRAPFGGIVIAKAAQPGEMISPVSGGGGFTRTGICTIVDMDSIEVQVDVSERYINRVTPDQPTIVTLNAYPETRLPAKVIAIIPTADRARATVRVRIGFVERDSRVLPDMGVSVAFLEEGTKTQRVDLPVGVEVPTTAVFGAGSDAIVWVFNNDSISRRPVTVERGLGSKVRVSGLERGEIVIVDLTPEQERNLVDGQLVTLAD